MFDLLMTTHFQIPVHISTVAIGKIFVLGEVMHKEFQKDSVHVNIFKNSVPIKRIQGCFIPLHLFKSFQAVRRIYKYLCYLMDWSLDLSKTLLCDPAIFGSAPKLI